MFLIDRNPTEAPCTCAKRRWAAQSVQIFWLGGPNSCLRFATCCQHVMYLVFKCIYISDIWYMTYVFIIHMYLLIRKIWPERLGAKLWYAGLSFWWSSEETLNAVAGQNPAPVGMFFPKQVYLWGSILEKKRLDTLVGALCCVGRGFGCAGRAGLGVRFGRALGLAVLGALGWVWRAELGWVWGLAVLGVLGDWARWVGRGVWLCWARWAGLGVGFGFGGRARRRFGFLCMVYLVHVFFSVFLVSLCLFSCVSQMCIMGLSKTKPGIGGAFHALSVVKKTQKQGCLECYLFNLLYLHCLGSMLVSF